MTEKEYLKDVRHCYLEIEAKKRQRERLLDLLTGTNIKPREVDVQTSSSGDKLGDIMARIADLDEAINREIANLCAKQRKAAEMIAELSRTEYRAIMTDYYLNAYTWEYVAEKNGYSMDWVFAMHSRALKELKDNRKKQYET